MSEYKSNEFISRISQKLPNGSYPTCPYCKGTNFSALPQFASILINTDMKNLNLGPSIPCGMVICNNCGHIEFFALGALGMLDNKENKNEDKPNNKK